jgi:hypothetical protein
MLREEAEIYHEVLYSVTRSTLLVAPHLSTYVELHII